jgi:hypothetical protein
MNNLVSDTLSAWILIETLNPGEVENKNNKLREEDFILNEKQNAVYDFESFFPIWEDERFKLNESAKKRGSIQFKMYRYCFNFGEIEQDIRYMFEDEEIQNPSEKNCYGYTFNVDDEGYLLIDTLHVPLLMSAMACIKKDKNVNIEALYFGHFEKFKHKCEEIMGGNKLTEGRLNKIDKIYAQYFEVYETEFSGFFNNAVGVHFVKPNDQKNDLNSFYISDIELAKNSPNETLKNYIYGIKDNEKENIDENKQLIEHYLQPDFYPDGRWPSLVEHRLSLMQQVAVNQITNDENKISSVNGPPGTGKTTLLKDIFAHNIVERAKIISELTNPREAFNYYKIHETDKYATAFLGEEFTKYKMVVTSSNNGAVENISKDLPIMKELFRETEKSKFPHFEKEYQTEVQKLNTFSDFAEKLINEPAWGLFSGVFGKKANIDKVMKYMAGAKDQFTLNNRLKDVFESIDIESEWEEAKISFNKTLDKVKQIKQEIKHGMNLFEKSKQSTEKINNCEEEITRLTQELKQLENIQKYETERDNLITKIDEISETIQDIKESIKLYQSQQSFINKIKQLFVNVNNPKIEKYEQQKNDLREQRIQLKERKFKLEQKIENNSKERETIESKKVEISQQLQKHKNNQQDFIIFKQQHSDIVFPQNSFWKTGNDAYSQRQESVLWTSDELQFQRGLLFLKAMVLHKLFLIGSAKEVESGLFDLKKRYEFINDSPSKVENAWNVLHLVLPVISTTFASFRSMYQTMPKDFIDYLYIDEAGQAVPQSAVGAIQRSRHVVVVGDPIQIEPVVTIDRNLIDSVRKAYNVPERLVNISASVQTLADNANRYGYWKDYDGAKQWIGIPLWVHRRCLNPMFTVCNKIAYEEKMVLPKDVKSNENKGKTGKMSWLNIDGKASHKQYVKKQGEAVINALKNEWNSSLKNGHKEPNVFIISPFTEVKKEIKKAAEQELKVFENDDFNISDWIDNSIGTVHTFQGKEADKVYFVTGTDETQDGAIKWSCQKPNLINVAVTRAKKEFIIVGDEERIKKFDYYKTIENEKNA